ncbi:MAG: hypothetical protein QW775_03835 [Ignisphaera sp.]|uniref:Uncharacterized protein n=1 Tax=Ignisphaera aggregans TaxID=334771 RepID=A0A7C4JJF5_9CREN
MYKKATVFFCGDIHIEKFSSVMIKKNEVAIKTSYTYFSTADIAFNSCNLVAKDHKTLGSISVGKIVDVGTEVKDLNEGSKAIAFVVQSPQYIYSLGGAQDVIVVEHNYVKAVKLTEYNDEELLLLAALSIDKEAIDYLKGKDVLLVGNDIAILTFAYYAQKYSCKLGVISKYTINISDVVKGDHVSLYDNSKSFDTIVIASSDPVVVCSSLRNFVKEKGSKVILYPHMHNLLRGRCIKNNEISIKIANLGNIEVGIEVFKAYRDNLLNQVKIVELEHLPKQVAEPLIVKHC